MADWHYTKDGQQHGPVNSGEMRRLAAAGELLPTDLVWKEGMAQWAPASQLKGLFGPAAAPAAPASPAPEAAPEAASASTFDVAPEAAPTPPVAPQSFTPQYASPDMQPQGYSGMAIASLVCGIVFCIPFSGLLAIIFGIIGINQTGAGKKKGRGMAIAGLCLGGSLGIIGVVSVLISILLPALNAARMQAQQIKSAANEKNIGLAISIYCNNNRGQFPSDLTTLAKAEQLSPMVFVSPASSDTPAATLDALETGGHCSYIYVGAELNSSTSSPNDVVLYEKPGTFRNGSNVLHGDGSVTFTSQSSLSNLPIPAPKAPSATER